VGSRKHDDGNADDGDKMTAQGHAIGSFPASGRLNQWGADRSKTGPQPGDQFERGSEVLKRVQSHGD
jgi:hypothetical protein